VLFRYSSPLDQTSLFSVDGCIRFAIGLNLLALAKSVARKAMVSILLSIKQERSFKLETLSEAFYFPESSGDPDLWLNFPIIQANVLVDRRPAFFHLLKDVPAADFISSPPVDQPFAHIVQVRLL